MSEHYERQLPDSDSYRERLEKSAATQAGQNAGRQSRGGLANEKAKEPNTINHDCRSRRRRTMLVESRPQT